MTIIGPDWDWTSQSSPTSLGAAEAAWVASHAEQQGADPEDDAAHKRRVEQLAYFRAERRGFTPGHELEDWLAAEQECECPAADWES